MPTKSDTEGTGDLPLQDSSLIHFLEVVRAGSVTLAAAKLGVAPSAVSRHIAKLEKQLGTLLFERKSNGMIPNAAGELLAAHTQRAWQQIDRLTVDIRALRGIRSGEIHVASTQGFAKDFIPGLVAQFRRVHPGIRFDLRIASTRQVGQMVRRGDVDIGITVSRISEEGLCVELRHSSPVFAIVSCDHALAKRQSLVLRQLTAYPMALPSKESTIRQLFDISCSRQGLECNTVFNTRSVDALISFVAAGGGVSLCGEIAISSHVRSGEVVAIPIRDREMQERHFEVITMAGRQLPLPCQAFVRHIQQALEEIRPFLAAARSRG